MVITVDKMKDFRKDAEQLTLFHFDEVKLCDLETYTSAIISYSTGIDSTGALYWALSHLNDKKTRMFLLYCDTGMEYEINIKLFYQTAERFNMTPVLIKNEESFMDILKRRQKWPDAKNRWCTAYLKTGATNKWIRSNRNILGKRCLFITGERRDESPRRARMPEVDVHPTSLKTTRGADFTCHWLRPCLDYSKPTMFSMGIQLGVKPHPCYEYCSRCSCMFCVFMKNEHAIANMKHHPERVMEWIQTEKEIGHTWKNRKTLGSLWEELTGEVWDKECEDVPKNITV